MFNGLQSEVLDRLFATESFFRATCSPGWPRTALFSKGAVFVHLYAAYEFCLSGAVAAAIQNVKAYAIPAGQLIPELASLILDPSFQSVIACSNRSEQWKRRSALLAKVFAPPPLDVPDTAFPKDGSHFRRGQLETVWNVFRIAAPIVPDGRLLPLIDELVENRNAIAHGRRTPEDVGRVYAKDDVLKKIAETQRVCLHIIQTMASHCSAPANLHR